MSLQIRDLIPMVHVADVARSVDFYAQFGFKVTNSFAPERGSALVWARMELGPTRIMFSKASGAFDPSQQAVLFYLYFDDTVATQAELAAKGVAVGEITHPWWAPRGEFRIIDPDGYVLMVMHT